MEKSICRTVILYGCIQLFFIFFFSLIQNFSVTSIFFYSGATILLHLILFCFLVYFRNDFFNLSTNQPLYTINLANKVTLLRISCLPSVAFLLHHKEIIEIKIFLPVLLILVFLTDTFDGQIARKKKQITKMGQMLDSISDYSLIAVISIVYYTNKMVPVWFFLLILFRLILQAIGMLIFILIKKPIETKSTWGGKITIAITMTLYVFELLRLYLSPDAKPFFIIIEYLCGLIILVLYLEKAAIFLRQGQRLKTEGKNT